MTHTASHSVPSRPVSVPSRPAPSEDEDGDDRRRLGAPLGGAQPPEDEGIRFQVTTVPEDPGTEVCFKCLHPLTSEEIDNDKTVIKPFLNGKGWLNRELHRACLGRLADVTVRQNYNGHHLPVPEAFR